MKRQYIGCLAACRVLDMREALPRAQGALRTMDRLVAQPTRARRLEPETRRWRTQIERLLEGEMGVEIGMAVQGGCSGMGLDDLALVGRVEAEGSGHGSAPADLASAADTAKQHGRRDSLVS